MDCKPARLFCPRGFSRQEYWSELPCSPPMDLPNPRIKLRSPTLPTNYLLYEPLQTQQTVFWFISTYVLLSSSLHIKKKIFFFFFYFSLTSKTFPSVSNQLLAVSIMYWFYLLFVVYWYVFGSVCYFLWPSKEVALWSSYNQKNMSRWGTNIAKSQRF